jgi:hypothetical protein
MKGGEVSSIADGDLVMCTSGQPRVMPGGDGTGGLGLSIWGSRTNRVLRSQELDNVVWIYAGTGVAAPTLTANYAAAPDGTLTAERLQIAATGTNQESIVYQAVSSGAVAVVTSFYVKGVSGSGTTDLCGYGAAYTCVPCSFVSTSWTRCEVSYTSTGLDFLFIGNDTKFNGGTSRSAVDVLIWGGQSETGVGVSPYIATVASTAARAAESASFPVTLTGTSNRCLAATHVSGTNIATVAAAIDARVDDNSRFVTFLSSGTTFASWINSGTTVFDSSAAAAVASSSNRLLSKYDGTTLTVCMNASCATSTPATMTLFTGVAVPTWIGCTSDGTATANAVVKNAAIDTTATGCAP